MPYFTPDDIDIDVDEFLDSCDSSEIRQAVDYLVEEGHIAPERKLSNKSEGGMSVGESFYIEALEKLAERYHTLTLEEEQIIINLAKKF
jgi:hypothetical protein